MKLTPGKVGCRFAGETDCTKLLALYANGLVNLILGVYFTKLCSLSKHWLAHSFWKKICHSISPTTLKKIATSSCWICELKFLRRLLNYVVRRSTNSICHEKLLILFSQKVG